MMSGMCYIVTLAKKKKKKKSHTKKCVKNLSKYNLSDNYEGIHYTILSLVCTL